MFLVKLSYFYLHVPIHSKNTEFNIKGYSNIFSYLLLPPQKEPPKPPKPTSYTEQYLAFSTNYFFLSTDKCIYNALASVTGTAGDTLLRNTS